jgi:hypothetical protein
MERGREPVRLKRNPAFILAVAAVMSAALWFYVQRVLIPYQVADAAVHGRPRGVLSDLYPRWLGARELLLHGRDPYSTEVTQEIQAGYYGRPLDPNRPEDPKDEQRFAYPVYVAFLLAPLVKLPFPDVRWISIAVLSILSALSVLLWMDALRWRLRPWATLVCLLLVMDSLALVQGIKLQQLTLLVGALLAASIALIPRGKLFLAGALLAVATIKPQLLWLLGFWLFVWTVARWRERQNLLWGFASMMAVLLIGAEFILPGWIGRFANAVIAYQRYTGGAAISDQLETHIGRELLILIGILGIAWQSWRARESPANSQEFQATCALALALTVVLVSITAPYNQVLLLPAVFLIAKHWRELWERSLLGRVFASLTALFIAWPWISSLGLGLASIMVPAASLQRAWAVPLWTSIGVPLAILPLLYALLPEDSRGPRFHYSGNPQVIRKAP